ncbi:hypothetical protein ADK55_35470 [Streptomyces sp. WM4235]|uniref:hypothetical protein n=1 Tax=Streptomyces sp. WM4235 TaxID=1415551 RepID=UPI0006AE87C3|nr:hypothetical protein [Streptomyces sp. WM4235]KOU37857.1 hypothetical protein ADK55_35470 [Streptomyces sp. WM4235]
MNGNALFHAVGLVIATLVLLPLPLLILTGHAPAWVRTRVVEPRWLALAMIGFWLPSLFNAVPRILNAGTGVVVACSLLGALLGLVGIAFFLRVAWATAQATRTGRTGRRR